MSEEPTHHRGCARVSASGRFIFPNTPCSCGAIPEPCDGQCGIVEMRQRAKCLDCALPYEQFPLDMLLPRSQWLQINPADGGVLCAACIVARVRRDFPRATAIHAVVEVAP